MKEKSKVSKVQQPISSAREYFTDDINEQVNAMDTKEMVEVLKGIPSTRIWIAILKYNQERLLYSQSMLFSADPFKNPTEMARQQGILLGLSDLQNAVIELNTEKTKEEDEESFG